LTPGKEEILEYSRDVATQHAKRPPSLTLRASENLPTADVVILARPDGDAIDAPPTADDSRSPCADAPAGDQRPSSSAANGELIDFDPERLEVKVPATPTPSDAYDPALLGLSQDFVGEANVKKFWDMIPVEKPPKERVFRVHPDPKFRLKTVLLDLKDDNETYLVLPALRQHLANEGTCGVFMLLACVSKQGSPFLWPIRMADPDGQWNSWHQSAWQIAEKAMIRWARMQSNREARHYMANYDKRPPEEQQEPVWPDLTFAEWLRLAFQGFTIDRLDHPVLKRLRLED
jgi:hypothetical protein